MDPLTHALASYTLKRAAFPRLARPATVAMVVAGTVADFDLLGAHAGPSAYITWSHTFCHSLLAAIFISVLAAAAFFFLHREDPAKHIAPLAVFVPALAASLLHLVFDLCQAQGIKLLWPISDRRFALDWLPHLDLWILAILLAGLLLPKLSSLVTEEIGAKSKGPRGRVGAVVALCAVLIYTGARGTLHSIAVATLDSRAYHGESPRRVAAFPQTASPFTWDGMVETERAILEVPVSVGPGASFDPESAHTSYKPDSSPALDAALRTATARRFLAYARFPQASLENGPEGYRIRLRAYAPDPDFRIQALIDVSSSGQILSESLSYDSGPQR
ncbi:MAG TPA: metal-dependent hydrolase [Candidatus Dormibacteraeota bacterium]|nr:metal-dependent hydrolase [Candidatus Dormibacteraeota bacterium]